MKHLLLLHNAIKQSLRTTQSKWMFIAIVIGFLVVFISLPVFTIPGNSFALQLSIYSWSNYLLLIILALLVGLTTVTQIEYVHTCKASKGAAIGAGGVGGATGVIAVLFGTASCASCLAPLFLFFGIGSGTLFFLLEYRLYLVLSGIALLFLLLFITARRMSLGCKRFPSNNSL